MWNLQPVSLNHSAWLLLGKAHYSTSLPKRTVWCQTTPFCVYLCCLIPNCIIPYLIVLLNRAFLHTISHFLVQRRRIVVVFCYE